MWPRLYCLGPSTRYVGPYRTSSGPECDDSISVIFDDGVVRGSSIRSDLGLLDSKIAPFTQAAYDEVRSKSCSVITMKNNWKCMYAFEKREEHSDGRWEGRC